MEPKDEAPAAPETAAPATKAKGRKKKAAAPADAREVPALGEAPALATPAPVPRAPAAPSFVGRAVKAVQFHQAPGGTKLNTTGISLEHLRKLKRAEPDMRLVGPGVWIRMDGEEFIVPFANIVRVELGPEGA